jgi:outer membrane protein
MNRCLIIGLWCAGALTAARAADLNEVYQRALAADPTMQQAQYTHLAARENKTQAILALLPLNAYLSKTWTGINGPGGEGPEAPGTYIPATGNVAVQVNLFSWSNWIALKQADHTVAQAEATYLAAEEDLISRVTQRYFAVLSAQDDLESQQSALESAQRQLDQAEKRYEVGLIAVTDVETARAQRDTYNASVIAGKRTVLSAEDQLRAITDENYDVLAAPRDELPLLRPDPASEDSWVTTALSQNPTLVANELAADIAHDNYLTAIGGHLPTITAGATRAWALQPNPSLSPFQEVETGGGLQITDTQDILWQINITVPIFTAGATQSKVRQAKLTWQAAKAGYQAQLRATEESARDAYQGVISQIAQVQALHQAVASNQVAMNSIESGYEVGTKTAVDVLTARQTLVLAQSNYADAKYAYLNNIVALRLAAGNLDRKTIDELNGWLAAQQTLPPTVTAPVAPPAAQ